MSAAISAALPEGFVYLSEFCPSLVIEASYSTSFNFTGEIVPGYTRREAVFSLKGAKALCDAQNLALKQGYKIKVFEAYRPVKAVDG